MPEEFMKALEGFAWSASALSRAWDTLRTEDEQLKAARDYPFDRSFEEVVHNILEWRDSVRGMQR